MKMLWNMVVKELIQLRRDPRILGVLFIAPIVQLTILAYAATTDIKMIELVVCDLDRSPASRQLIEDFTASTYFRRVATVDTQDALDDFLANGTAKVAMTIPAGFSAERAAGRTGRVQIVTDGSDAMVGTLGLAYAQGVLQTAAAKDGPGMPLDLRPTILYNPDLVSRYFMVPGVLALIILIMTMMLSSMAIVRETEIGTMEQLLVTPLTPGAVIAGKLVPYALVGVVEFLTALAVVLFWFEIPLRGSFWTLALLTAPFIVCCLGLGLLVSNLSRTQQQAMMISTFVMMMPQIYLSGFVFPIQNMPQIFQWVTYAIPLRYYITILRGVFLKGAGLDVLWPQGLALVGLAILILTFARLRYRVRLG
ncbi:MAG: ABC transporter permease [Acidobacteriota bacterium]|nr:ABC transporter permease [Acidobacteriota bacterium]